MQKLSRNHVSNLKKSSISELFDDFNKKLNEKGLSEFEMGHFKLRPKNLRGNCNPGWHEEPYIDDLGNVTMICVKDKK